MTFACLGEPAPVKIDGLPAHVIRDAQAAVHHVQDDPVGGGPDGLDQVERHAVAAQLVGVEDAERGMQPESMTSMYGFSLSDPVGVIQQGVYRVAGSAVLLVAVPRQG